MRGSPRNGRSKVRYWARSLDTNKEFVGTKFIPNRLFGDKQIVNYLIVQKHNKRGMNISVDKIKIVSDTFFL